LRNLNKITWQSNFTKRRNLMSGIRSLIISTSVVATIMTVAFVSGKNFTEAPIDSRATELLVEK